MTRRAAESGFERFLNATIDATQTEFSVGRALEGTKAGPGGRVVDRLRDRTDALERHVVEPELVEYRERTMRQFLTVLDYVESDEPFEAFENELIAHDNYMNALDDGVSATKQLAITDASLDRLRRLAEGVDPIVERPEDDFWTAAEGALDGEEALYFVEETFPFTGPFREHRESFVFETELDPNEVIDSRLLPSLPSVTVDFTAEAIRAMGHAEDRIIHDLRGEVRERFEM